MYKNDTISQMRSYRTLSASSYNLALGLVLLWSFGLNWLLVTTVPFEVIKAINPIAFIVGYIVCAVVGCILIFSTENPAVSFAGHNLVVLPISLVLVLIIPGHSQEHIVAAVRTTTFLTAGMMIMGTMFPNFFKRIESGLFWALLIAIVVEMVQTIVFKVKLEIMDWVVAAIFCGFIGVDWGRANSVERTANNAIVSAAALYLDIINLFLNVLDIVSDD